MKRIHWSLDSVYETEKHSENLQRRSAENSLALFPFRRKENFFYASVDGLKVRFIAPIRTEEFALWSRKVYFPNLSHCRSRNFHFALK